MSRDYVTVERFFHQLKNPEFNNVNDTALQLTVDTVVDFVVYFRVVINTTRYSVYGRTANGMLEYADLLKDLYAQLPTKYQENFYEDEGLSEKLVLSFKETLQIEIEGDKFPTVYL